MKRSHPLVLSFVTICLLAAAAAILLWPASTAEPIPAEQADTSDAALPAEGCELLQTLAYTRCGHRVVRRVTAPQEVYGKTLENVQAMYPDWRITEFAAKLIKMEQEPDMYCPDHLVLMPDGAGMLCVFQNKYGDALALLNELSIPVKDLPAAAQEDVAFGLGFATAEELDQWLESVES